MHCIQFILQTDRDPDKQSIYWEFYTVYITNRQRPRWQAKYILRVLYSLYYRQRPREAKYILRVLYSLCYKQTETQTSKVYIESFIQSILQTDRDPDKQSIY